MNCTFAANSGHEGGAALCAHSAGILDVTNCILWVDGDYHLKSQVGRWDNAGQSWIQDTVTSPCIDTGSPADFNDNVATDDEAPLMFADVRL